MKNYFTLFLVLLSLVVNSQCLINFTPVDPGSELVIIGQGVDTSINSSTSLDFNGSGIITFTYSGYDCGDMFYFDCSSTSYNSGPMLDGFEVLINAPLPVELIFFTGEQVENSVFFTWATASEEGNSHFEVQKSTDGFTFETIGVVESSGSGYSLDQQKYTFYDPEPTNGTAYYRLKQVDFSTIFDYSNTIPIEFASKIKMRLRGNVVQSMLSVEGDGLAYIFNSSGILVKSISLTESNTISVDLTSLPSGMYYIKNRDTLLRFVRF
tara:strand:+ start:16652 stop:17452 length:801 start_codon:yes stop_codon:yes gene_type:complete